MTLKKFLATKRKWLQSPTMFCKLLHPCCYWEIPNEILLSRLNWSVPCLFIVSRMYIKKQLGTLDIRQIILGANITSGKASAVSANRAGGSETLSRVKRKFLGYKEHLDWLKIDLNAVEIRAIQDYIHTKS